MLSFTCIVTQVLFSGSDFWLTLWTNSEERRGTSPLSNLTVQIQEGSYLNGTTNDVNKTFSNDWWKNPDTLTGIYVFTILIVSLFIFSMIRTIHFFLMCMISSVSLHNKMFQAVIRAQLLFFDRNPVGNMIALVIKLNLYSYLRKKKLGRVLNRFAKDIGCMDEMLPSAFYDVITVTKSDLLT